MIKGLEKSIEYEPEGPRRENEIAYLHFAQVHGYPEDPYCLRAVDDVARCMDALEVIKIFAHNKEHMQYALSCVSCRSYVYLLPTKLHAKSFQVGGRRWLC